MIYRERTREPNIRIINDDYKNHIDHIASAGNVVVVTDPPFNIGYHYNEYKDRMDDAQYYGMLAEIVKTFPCVMVHYPESLHRVSMASGVFPEKICAWVYNSNTAKQHRDCAFYGVKPSFKNAWQPYKNPNDKRIRERIKNGSRGGRMYDWWNVNQVKNVSKEKTGHPCQMPVEIMKNIVCTLPENVTVFDPFMGSGTTAVACMQLGYDFIGCEINAEYCYMAEKRLEIEKT